MNLKRPLLLGIILLMVISGGYYFIKLRSKVDKPQTEKTKIRFCHVSTSTIFPVIVAEKKGFFDNEGLDVELTNIDRQPGAEISLLGSGVLDGCSQSKILTMKSVADGVPIKVVGDALSNQGIPILRFVTKSNSNIKSIKDLEGKDFALFLGSSHEYYFDRITSKLDVDTKKINIISLPMAETVTSFKADKTKAVIVDSTGYRDLLKSFELRELSVSTDVMPNSAVAGILFADKFIQENPEAVRKTVRAIYAAAKYVNENQNEAKKILIADGLDPMWEKAELPHYATDNSSLKEGAEDVLLWIKEKGYLKKDISLDDIFWTP